MKAQTYRLLLDGTTICHIAFRAEYEWLLEPGHAEQADTWLGEIDMRLARLRGDGAFFMAPRQLTPADTSRIKADFERYRDVYGPSQRMLQLIRGCKDDFSLLVGQTLQLAELNQAVNQSATLESQLRGLQTVIRDGQARFTNRELIKKLLEHLRAEGYLYLVNSNQELYEVTGKIDQLNSVLSFLAEHTDLMGNGEDDHQADDQTLFDSKGDDSV